MALTWWTLLPVILNAAHLMSWYLLLLVLMSGNGIGQIAACAVLVVFTCLAAHYCDELYVLAGGKVVAHGKPSEIITEELLADVFSVRAQVIQLGNGHPHIIFEGAITA